MSPRSPLNWSNGITIWIYCIFCLSIVYAQWCNIASSCVGQTYIGADQFIFSGYKSAFGPTTSYSGDNATCQGTLACDSIAFIHTTAGDLNCRGRESCSHSKDLQSSAQIWCSGSLSCSFSNLTSSSIDCAGYLSCRNSFISGMSTITANGLFSLYQATIEHTNTEHALTIGLHGSYAGFGGLLLCSNGATCNINCNTHESCYMFYVDCKQGTCNVVARDTAVPPILPLNITNTPYNRSLVATLPKLFPSELIVSTNDTSCRIDQWNYDDYGENSNGSINVPLNSEAPVCCRAAHSCNAARVTLPNHDLMCGAYFACAYSVVRSHINGSIYCEGKQSCLGMSISSTNALYCAGRNACQQANIQKVSYVICSGRSACDRANFTSGGTDLNIYMSALEAGGDKEATIIHCEETDTCNIYCNGLNSCINARIFCACEQNCNVECNAQAQLCPEVVIGTRQCLTVYPTENDGDNDKTNNSALFYISLPITVHVMVVTIAFIVAVFCVVFCLCLKCRAQRQAPNSQREDDSDNDGMKAIQKNDPMDLEEAKQHDAISDKEGQEDSFEDVQLQLGEDSVSKSNQSEKVHQPGSSESKDAQQVIVPFHGTKEEYYDQMKMKSVNAFDDSDGIYGIPGNEMNTIDRSKETDQNELIDWLRSKGLKHCVIHFVSNGYESLDYVKDITEVQQLRDIGINSEADQNKLMRFIKLELNPDQSHKKEDVGMHVMITSK